MPIPQVLQPFHVLPVQYSNSRQSVAGIQGVNIEIKDWFDFTQASAGFHVIFQYIHV